MMNATNKVFPAFPIVVYDRHGEIMDVHAGMSLRDYFAAKAMQGLLSGSGDEDGYVGYDADALAEQVYVMADAMLKAREA